MRSRLRGTLLDAYHLKSALEGTSQRLGEKAARQSFNILVARLTACIGRPIDDERSYLWRSAIERHGQDEHKDDVKSVLLDSIRDLSLGAIDTNSPDALSIVQELLLSKYVTLVRVGIYLCAERYGIVGKEFWQNLNLNWFTEAAYWHEIFWLIRRGFPRFSAAERSRFIAVVKAARGDWVHGSDTERLDGELRRDLLHPAVGLGDTEVDGLYHEFVARYGPVRDHPDFHHYSSAGWVGESSPLTPEQILEMDGAQLLESMESFVPSRSIDGPTFRGYAMTLSAAVRASSDGFADRMHAFNTSSRPFQHGLFRGLRDRWAEDKKDIPWAVALTLAKEIVANPSFRRDLEDDTSTGWEPTVHWLISDIADLVKAGATAARSMPDDCLMPALAILGALLDRIPIDAERHDDPVSHAINSPRGRTIESLIHLSLRVRKQSDSKDNLWKSIGPIFERELASSQTGENSDFSALAGMYFSNLHYLNEDWTTQNVDRIFSTANKEAWRAAAYGFSYQRHMFEWLFRILRDRGHLHRMLGDDTLPSQVSEKAIQFVGLAYLEGIESLGGDNLLSEIITRLNSSHINRLSWFFWTLRGHPDYATDGAAKVLAFWKRVDLETKDEPGKHVDVASGLNLLAVFISSLDHELTEVWSRAIPHAQVRHHGYVVMENLARLASMNSRNVATLFRAALSGFLPDYKPQDIQKCVLELALNGCGEDAEWICNEYARRGSTMLKESYSKIREVQRKS